MSAPAVAKCETFTVERQPDGAWVATCDACGWRGEPEAHPLDVQLAEHVALSRAAAAL